MGAVLAGGSGRRLGATSKPAVLLAGRPLVSYPVEAMRQVCDQVLVVCKADTPLPSLPAVDGRWDEPDEPRHPLTGIIHALQQADGPVLVCAADMPFVTTEVLRTLLKPSTAAVVATTNGRLQPVLALYRPMVLHRLNEAASDAPLTRTVEALEPATVEVPEAVTFSVNTPEDLRAAEARLSA